MKNSQINIQASNLYDLRVETSISMPNVSVRNSSLGSVANRNMQKIFKIKKWKFSKILVRSFMMRNEEIEENFFK
eukprot:snap_masked-scaffold_7-processed-gene-3.55-mRNA-1 protein AED:1.00 eAED:1.00 QI:0/0/0/0/1/1/2/0/74